MYLKINYFYHIIYWINQNFISFCWKINTIAKKFTIDIKNLKRQKKTNLAINKIETIINFETLPEDKIDFFVNIALSIYEEDNNKLESFQILKKILFIKKENKNLEKLEIKYFLILNDIINDKLKEKKIEESIKQIEEEKEKKKLFKYIKKFNT